MLIMLKMLNRMLKMLNKMFKTSKCENNNSNYVVLIKIINSDG